MSVPVRLSGVSKRYAEHDVQALQDVTLTIPAGSFAALMGPSGCGKSTLLNLIGAIDVPSAGEIRVGELDLARLDDVARTAFRRDRLGFVFQFFNLLPTLTVFENVALPLELRGVSGGALRTRVLSTLDAVGMADRERFSPAQLSGGQMQRVAIARALVHEPDLILADEPTGNLDTENGRQVMALLTGLCRERGRTLIMATHSDEAAAGADMLLKMRDGRLLSPAGLSS